MQKKIIPNIGDLIVFKKPTTILCYVDKLKFYKSDDFIIILKCNSINELRILWNENNGVYVEDEDKLLISLYRNEYIYNLDIKLYRKKK